MNAVRKTSGLLRSSKNLTLFRRLAHDNKPGLGEGLPPIGQRQKEQLMNWVPSGAIYGAAVFLGIVYYTDWRVITDYIPYYRGKYVTED